MEEWKKCIAIGNRRFNSDYFNAAKLSYETAKKHAQALFPYWSDPEEAISALIISYHNLADLHQTQGHLSAAREELECVHNIVLRALFVTPIASARHHALSRASQITYSALIEHKRSFINNTHH